MPGLDDFDPYGTVPHRGWCGAVHRLTHDLGDSTWRGRALGSACKSPFCGFLQATPLGCGESDYGPHTPSSAGGRLRNVPRLTTVSKPSHQDFFWHSATVAADADISTFNFVVIVVTGCRVTWSRPANFLPKPLEKVRRPVLWAWKDSTFSKALGPALAAKRYCVLTNGGRDRFRTASSLIPSAGQHKKTAKRPSGSVCCLTAPSRG